MQEKIELTQEQEQNNPNQVMEDLFRKSREALFVIFDREKDPESPVIRNTIMQQIEKLPKSKREFVSAEEMYRRGLEYYATEKGGFGEAKGLKQKYVDLYAEEIAKSIRDKEHDEVNEPIEKAVQDFAKRMEEFTPTEITSLRNDIWERFLADKAAE